MAKDITYEPIKFKRIQHNANAQIKHKNVELLSDVAMNRGEVTHKRKMQKYILNTAIVAVVAFVILFRYTIVSDNTSKLSQLKRQYTDISEKNINLQCGIDSKTDSSSLEVAAGELGMSQPSKSQKISVDVCGNDYVEVNKVEKVASAKETSQFYATMIETLGNVLEYLY